MTALFLQVFAVFGLAYIVGHSQISLWFRTWLYPKHALAAWFVDMLECAGCFSFHAGWIGSLLHLFPFHPLTAACFFCGTSITLALLTGLTPRKNNGP